MNATEAAIATALKAHAMRLRPWPRLTDYQMFDWRSFDGLIDIRTGLTIIALMNEVPGSGKLGDLMTVFEHAADCANTEVQVISFWNERLARWFLRRGYLPFESDSAKGVRRPIGFSCGVQIDSR